MDDASQRDGGHITPDGDTRAWLANAQGLYLLDLEFMRRGVIFGLAFSVFAAGLMPLSTCALFSSKMAECAEATIALPCDQMYAPVQEPNCPEVRINPAALRRKPHSQNCSSKGLRLDRLSRWSYRRARLWFRAPDPTAHLMPSKTLPRLPFNPFSVPS